MVLSSAVSAIDGNVSEEYQCKISACNNFAPPLSLLQSRLFLVLAVLHCGCDITVVIGYAVSLYLFRVLPFYFRGFDVV